MESGIQLKESGIPLAIGNLNPSSIDKELNPESGIHYLDCGLHSVESRIHNCLGSTYIGRQAGVIIKVLLTLEHKKPVHTKINLE